MNNETLTRRLQAIRQLMDISFGSLWIVGEKLWQEKLVPFGYDRRSTRCGHPGICVRGNAEDAGLHATVPMWYGTSRRKDPSYQVRNFFNESGRAEQAHVTYFGHFQAVQIDLRHMGSRPVTDSDFRHWNPSVRRRDERRGVLSKQEEAMKNIVRPNAGRPRLEQQEIENLKSFMRENLSLVGAVA